MDEALLGLSDGDLAAVADALRAGRLSPPFAPVTLQPWVPAEARGPVSDALWALATAGLGPPQIAAALGLLLADRRRRPRVEDVVDLVTSGPEGAGTANRDTGVVVRDLFARAERSVLVVGFAVYQGKQVFRELADRMAVRPDLKVRLCLDVHRGVNDTATAEDLVRDFSFRFRSSQWPRDRPLPEMYYDPRGVEPSAAKRSSLHAKCVVVDGETSFVTSANFTEAAQERNVEAGLLLRSSWLAGRLAKHFDTLIAERLLVPLHVGSV
jgi:phosphatidylserine/phosphatidylglycerophosphate/cardiolipin synthase-like enzyme